MGPKLLVTADAFVIIAKIAAAVEHQLVIVDLQGRGWCDE
jgi:hypothetical protein